MDKSGWKIITGGVRALAGLYGLFQAAVAVREILSRPDRDVLVDMMGSVVSLHSLYLGAALVGAVMMLLSGWHVVALGHARMKAQSASSRFRELDGLIERAMVVFIADYAKSVEMGKEPFFLSSTRATVREMMYAFDDLNIPYPPTVRDAVEPWRILFPRYLAAARSGKIKEARGLWSGEGTATCRTDPS